MTHFNALNQDMYMRIATELYLKRLIVGGFEGVYEIGKNFRNEGMDKTHNPEFTCMELYVSYKDLNWGMDFTEKMLETICTAVNGKPEVEIDGKVISFSIPDPSGENDATYDHTAKALQAYLRLLFPYILKWLGAERC